MTAFVTRRDAVLGALASGAIESVGMRGASAGQAGVARFAAARKTAGGRYEAVIFDAAGSDIVTVPLAARGHDVAVCPRTQTVVVFARRPGTFAVAFSARGDRTPYVFATPSDRHFYGHGAFSGDGLLLYATENAFDDGTGRIGVYDASADFVRVGEFATHGIGPHDIALMPDGQTLLVANGGIETHPDVGAGRTKLNLGTMAPNLAYIDTRSGDLIERHTLPSSLQRLSLRHVDIGARGTVIVGGQLQRGGPPDAPVAMAHRMGTPLRPVPLTREARGALRGYVSSVAVDAQGDVAALTSARGGAIVLINVRSGDVIDVRRRRDVSGVAAGAGGAFVVTTGAGTIAAEPSHAVRATDATPIHRSGIHWDNHAVRVR
ncbi:MAG: DUF1513 domain-containing protein [Pseudomonadota bacterium]